MDTAVSFKTHLPLLVLFVTKASADANATVKKPVAITTMGDTSRVRSLIAAVSLLMCRIIRRNEYDGRNLLVLHARTVIRLCGITKVT